MTDAPISRFDSERADFKEQLTPAALELLETYADRYKERIVAESRKIQGGNPSDKLRLNPLQAALEASDVSQSRNDGAWLPFRSIIVPLCIFATVATTTFYLLLSGIGPSPLWRSGLSAAVSATLGIGGAMLWVAGRRLKYLENRSRATYSNLLLRTIDILETMARKIAARLLGTDIDTMSLSEVLAALESANIWQSPDSADFRNALRVRNDIVHEAHLKLDHAALADATSTVRRLVKVLQDTELLRPAQGMRAEHVGEYVQFEKRVGEALTRVAGDASVIGAPESGYDYLIEAGSDLIRVNVKYRSKGKLVLQDFLRSVDRSSNAAGPGVLIITNATPSEKLRESNLLWAADRQVEVVTWRSPDDDAVLAEAIRRLSSGRKNQTPAGPRFEIYTDARGDFRFRLKGVNGEILAVSEGYNTRAGVIKSVNAVKGAASGAEPVDRT